jgi:hypothetical protein
MASAEVNSIGTRRFWDLFHALPEDIRELGVKNYQLWRSNPRHPSLHFRRLQGSIDLFSVRVGDHYRALGLLKADTMVWVGSARMPNTTGSPVRSRVAVPRQVRPRKRAMNVTVHIPDDLAKRLTATGGDSSRQACLHLFLSSRSHPHTRNA